MIQQMNGFDVNPKIPTYPITNNATTKERKDDKTEATRAAPDVFVPGAGVVAPAPPAPAAVVVTTLLFVPVPELLEAWDVGILTS